MPPRKQPPRPMSRRCAATSRGCSDWETDPVRAVVPVDAVGLEERAAMLATRSIKKETKAAALDLLIRICDLTTLEGSDTRGKVLSLCAKARRPDVRDATVPPVAAVCVYPTMVPYAVEGLAGSDIHIASVAGSFPA